MLTFKFENIKKFLLPMVLLGLLIGFGIAWFKNPTVRMIGEQQNTTESGYLTPSGEYKPML
jgi:hypothetical protein